MSDRFTDRPKARAVPSVRHGKADSGRSIYTLVLLISAITAALLGVTLAIVTMPDVGPIRAPGADSKP